jgi:hypothetical protein
VSKSAQTDQFFDVPYRDMQEATAIAEYRAYLIGIDGRIIGYEPIICTDDAEAFAKAQRLVDGVHAVEVWSGPRLVTRFQQTQVERRRR